jgi:hypothetical protein
MPDLETMTDADLRAYKRDLVLEQRRLRGLQWEAEQALEDKRAKADARWARAVELAPGHETEEAERLFALSDEEFAAYEAEVAALGQSSEERHRNARERKDARVFVPDNGPRARAEAPPPQARKGA